MINIQNLIDDEKCYETVRQIRWPKGTKCAYCDSEQISKRGKDDTQKFRQRYHCNDCNKDFDDLTNTIFAKHHQPLKTWILCLLRSWLRPHRGISQEKLPTYLAFFEFTHNMRKRGKALIGSLLELFLQREPMMPMTSPKPI